MWRLNTSKELDLIVPMILKELPEQDRKEFSGKDLKKYLENKYGNPEIISSSPTAIESVFVIEGIKIGIIEDLATNITGYSIYRGDIPDVFIQKQPAPCINGYSRTSIVTTTSPAIPVSVIAWLFGGGPVVWALAIANFITHSGGCFGGKSGCMRTVYSTCTVTTVGGTAGVIITPIRVWGIPVSATATAVCTTTITANCI